MVASGAGCGTFCPLAGLGRVRGKEVSVSLLDDTRCRAGRTLLRVARHPCRDTFLRQAAWRTLGGASAHGEEQGD